MSKRKDWRRTTKPGKLYIHFFNLTLKEFVLEGVKDKVTEAYFLADAKRKGTKFTQADDKLTVSLPEKAPSKIAPALRPETNR